MGNTMGAFLQVVFGHHLIKQSISILVQLLPFLQLFAFILFILQPLHLSMDY